MMKRHQFPLIVTTCVFIDRLICNQEVAGSIAVVSTKADERK